MAIDSTGAAPASSTALHASLTPTTRSTGGPVLDKTTGVTLPAGTEVQMLLHALHTHPEHWGDDAAVWDPDRWLPDAPNGRRRGDAVFFPFLDGVRRCAGMYLAEVEFAILLYTFVAIYGVSVDGPWAGKPSPSSAVVGATSGPAAASRFKLRLAADMFTAIDGTLPYSWPSADSIR